MNRALCLVLAVAFATFATAQDREPQAGETRPGICFAEYAECEICARISNTLRELAETTFGERVAPDVLRMPKQARHEHRVQFFPTHVSRESPVIDLNEVVLRLDFEAPAAGQPAQAGSVGSSILRIGKKVYKDTLVAKDKAPAWTALAADLQRFRLEYKGASPYGVPFSVSADQGVPIALIRAALQKVAETYGGMQGHPKLPGAPAETAGKWRPVLEREYDEVQRPAREEVEAPILVLEEEVEVVEGPPQDGEEVERPIIVLEEEVVVVEETPQAPRSAVDAYGAGGGAAGGFLHRFGKGSLLAEGGSEHTEASLRGALRWFKFHSQAPDGSFGEGGAKVATTSRALLAFLGAGQTHRAGPFKATVNKALKFLRANQLATGGFGDLRTHALATAALTEAWVLSRDFRLRKNVEKAWIHLEGEDFADDAGVALLIAEALSAPVEIPAILKLRAASRARLEAYFSATADTTRWEIPVGQVLVNERGTPAFEAGAKALASLKVEESNARRWVTSAAFQVGGEAWQSWNARMQEHVLPSQVRQEGPTGGSWPAEGGGSALDATLDHVLCLEAYYRYERKK